jgi:hypothetical protein
VSEKGVKSKVVVSDNSYVNKCRLVMVESMRYTVVVQRGLRAHERSRVFSKWQAQARVGQ